MSKEWLTERRRLVPRVSRVFRLRYRSAGHLLLSYCTNLSRGGLFVATPTPLPHGSQLTLQLEIPDGEPAVLEATVRWVRPPNTPGGPPGMGVAFDRIDLVLGEQIDRIVAEFVPLRVAIIGDPRQSYQHVAALVRSLVSCEVTNFALAADVLTRVGHVDLVIVDVDPTPEIALRLLAELDATSPRSPALALVAAKAPELQIKAAEFARVVAAPAESSELQARVLETLGQVSATQD